MRYLESGAIISECGLYRYRLWRSWANGPRVVFLGLNPSTADAEVDDPTIRRCVGFAKTWGFDGIEMLNLFAFRATEPDVMKASADPVGEMNNEHLWAVASEAKAKEAPVIAAWGVHGAFRGRDREVMATIPDLQCLGITKDGHPKHPLYLRADSKPVLLRELLTQRTT